MAAADLDEHSLQELLEALKADGCDVEESKQVILTGQVCADITELVGARSREFLAPFHERFPAIYPFMVQWESGTATVVYGNMNSLVHSVKEAMEGWRSKNTQDDDRPVTRKEFHNAIIALSRRTDELKGQVEHAMYTVTRRKTPTYLTSETPSYNAADRVNCIGYAYNIEKELYVGQLGGINCAFLDTDLKLLREVFCWDGYYNGAFYIEFGRWKTRADEPTPKEPNDAEGWYLVAVWVSRKKKKDVYRREKVVADIHLARRGPDGVWYHKPGTRPAVTAHSLGTLSLPVLLNKTVLAQEDTSSQDEGAYLRYHQYELVGFLYISHEFSKIRCADDEKLTSIPSRAWPDDDHVRDRYDPPNIWTTTSGGSIE